jgi:hypothetical protein
VGRPRTFVTASLAGDRIQSEVGTAARIADIRSRITEVLRDPNDRGEVRALLACLGGAVAEAQAVFQELLYKPEAGTRLLTALEAAALLSVPVRTVYRMAATYPFTRRPTPGSLRFDERALKEWIGRGGR